MEIVAHTKHYVTGADKKYIEGILSWKLVDSAIIIIIFKKKMDYSAGSELR